MSEDPAHYAARVFVCEVCRKEFTPSDEEAEALAELERAFGLDAAKCSAICEDCRRRVEGGQRDRAL